MAQGTSEGGLGGCFVVGVRGLLRSTGGGGAFLTGRRLLSVVPVEHTEPVSSSDVLDMLVADPTDKNELERILSSEGIVSSPGPLYLSSVGSSSTSYKTERRTKSAYLLLHRILMWVFFMTFSGFFLVHCFRSLFIFYSKWTIIV